MAPASLRWVPASIVAIALTACSDSVGPSSMVIDVVDGDGQLGLAGWTLERSLRVLVRGDDGTPIEGVWVEFTVTAGGGAPASDLALTDGDGGAVSRWVLGQAGPQRLAVRLVSPFRTPALAEFQATILPASEADLLVVHGALGPLRGAMLASEDGSFGDPMSALAVDTLVAVPPRSRPGSAIAVFGHANRPVLAEPAWTEGYDTVHVTLEPPVSVDLWMDIRQGDYDEMVRRLGSALDTVQLIWGATGMGVTVGNVTYSDRTEPQPVWLAAPCADQVAVPPKQIRVSVITAIGYDGAEGYACHHDLVFITYRGLVESPGARLIAHELGHTFSLDHVSRGIMGTGRAISNRFHDGEAFIAHFDDGSGLNALYSSQPGAQLRPCRFAVTSCPPQLLELGAR